MDLQANENGLDFNVTCRIKIEFKTRSNHVSLNDKINLILNDFISHFQHLLIHFSILIMNFFE